MPNKFRGRVTGNNFQIGKVHTLKVGGGPTKSRGKPPPKDKPNGAAFAAGFAAFLVFGIIGSSCQGGEDGPVFPATDQRTRPIGVSDDAVAKVVADKLAQ